MTLWPKPIEYNWRGQRLQLAHEGQEVTLKPFGPNSWLRCTATIDAIDEEQQLVRLVDRKRSVVITFEDWTYMQAEPHPFSRN